MTATKTVTVSNAVDTYSDKTKPNKPRHRAARLAVQSGSSGAEAWLYFGFPAPRGAKVITAKLRLPTDGSFGGVSTTLTVQRVTSKFTASKLTDNDGKPTSTSSGEVAVTKSSTGDGDWWEWDVTAMMQLVANGAAWYGFRVISGSTTRHFFRSSQAGGNLRPELVVTYADAPDKPTTVSPSGQVVAASKPVVEMDYTDPTSGTLTAAQVLVSTVVAMTAPFDSGEVTVPAGSKARVNLAATAYAGVANGITAWWQGRVKDESGEWSAYSNPASFTRYDKGTLVINLPSSGSPIVTDYTPTVTWAFTPPASPGGVTAARHRVVVERVSDGAVVYDSGQVPGAATSHTVQGAGGVAVLVKGTSYRLRVQVWDSLDRVVSSDSPAYVEATRAFTVVNGATVPIAGLDLTVLTAPPRVVATFTRATAPETFVALLDDVPVAVDLNPATLSTGGTGYSYTFPVLRPNAEASYGIAAVENGIISTGAEVVEKVRVGGAWLIDRDVPSRYLFLAKTGGSTIELGEDGSTLIPLGAESGIRVTQGLRGYEGTITGVLIEYAGRTLQQWVDEALAMRGRPGRTYVLMIGSEAFEVFIGDLKVRPTGDSTPGLRPCSFTFGQTSRQRVAVSL